MYCFHELTYKSYFTNIFIAVNLARNKSFKNFLTKIISFIAKICIENKNLVVHPPSYKMK